MAQRIFISGASSGIGRALAVELSQGGNILVISARRREVLEEVAEACCKAGAQEVLVVPADLSQPEECKRAVLEAEKRFGGIDLLISNAGVSRHAPADKLMWEDCKYIFDTNINGAISLVLAALPGMLERGSGHIAGVSSLAGFRGMPTSAAYSASKAAFTVFLESLRIELTPKGIPVSIISPGFVATPLTQKNKFPMPFIMTAEKAAKIISQGLSRRKRHIAFPGITHLAVRLSQWIPACLYDRVLAMAKK